MHKNYFLGQHKIMRAIHFIQLSLFSICLVSCAANPHSQNRDIDSTLITRKSSIADTFEPGKIINPVYCLSDPSKSYALYIPLKTHNQNLPVVYFFDPHGDGSLPLQKYQALADEYQFIFIGSNDSKNGNDLNESENIWNILNEDVQKRIKINSNRIYTCGFSGGAKVASFIALQHPEIKGLIADGAALPDINSQNFNFSFTGIAGNGDMNRSDLISINKSLDKTQAKHRLILFNGKHEWAPETVMNTAFAGFQLDAMRDHVIPNNSEFIDSFVSKNQKSIEQNLKENDFLAAKENCQLMISMMDKLTDKINWFQKKSDSISENPIFQNQSKEEVAILAKEENIKAIYEKHFFVADLNYWKQTIKEVDEKAKLKNPESAMYQRLQAYLSLAFYSISNQIINKKAYDQAAYFVSLYKLADPTNTEAWYFSAILDAHKNDIISAKTDLEKAVALGFNDKKRLESQPEFQNSSIISALPEIERKMK
ncbi:MAG: hypothetical protein ABI359_15915 [Ginsengibacter sp.]